MESKDEILAKSESYNLAKPLTEEEFDEALDYLATVLLFGTRWEEILIKNRRARREFPVIDDMSLLCKVDDCPFASKCPVLKRMTDVNDRLQLLGTECRADREYGTKLFARLLRDLDISPDSFSDVMTVSNLVRAYVTDRRIDWQIAVDGHMHESPSIVDPRTGKMYTKKEAHVLFNVRKELAKQIRALQEQLIASRKDRANFAKDMKQHANALRDLLTGNAFNDDIVDAEITEEEE